MTHLVAKGKVVVVDDETEMREMLMDYLRSIGYISIGFPLATQALEAFDKNPSEYVDVDLVISDLNMPQMNGLEFIEKVKERFPGLPIVLITAFGSIESAIEATRRGAYDYMTKPFKLKEMGATIERAINYSQLKKENRLLRTELKKTWSFGNIIGKSKSMRALFDLIQRLSSASANVLISGESGTGKEIVAKAIHEGGVRGNKPFVAVNCTAIPDTLMESELFGHVRGAFTGAVANKRGLFEEADGGTIFLDEIGDLDLSLQAKLLRVLQEREIKPVGDSNSRKIDVRVIAATHKDLKKAIKEGCFREDLYYRLSVIPVVIPPLRHRKEDIPLLVDFFLKKYSAANSSQVRGFNAGAMKKLVNARWEGNVRELENVIERLVVLSPKTVITEDEIPTLEDDNLDDFFGKITSDWPTIDELTKRYMRRVLDKTGGRKEKASHILGINRRTLYRKEREYGFVDSDLDSDSDIDKSEDTL
ncbi:MAG: sigma-54-dependent Fis family transcriptional regulator [Bdellovibrionales bacterium]|nr:sigma-54-dependent Fis family transcriptional regulator [Bdellovibrionales bacterium]